MRYRFLCLLAATVLIPTARAQETPTKSAEEIAAELANPNTALASMTLKNQFKFFEGDLPKADDQWSYTALFQPVLPFPKESGDKIIFRPAFPLLIEQPVYNPDKQGFETKSGLGDIAFDLVYAPKSEGQMLTGVGLIGSFPTATATGLGTDRFTAGPEALIGVLTPKHVGVFFPNHQWDYAGSGDSSVSITTLQVIYTYLPGGGWNVGTAPINTYNWENEQWTVPINLNIGKTVTLNGKPWKLSAEINYFVEKNGTFANEWMIGFNVTPVVKNYFASMFGDMLN